LRLTIVGGGAIDRWQEIRPTLPSSLAALDCSDCGVDRQKTEF
jgi:hypothetical protein